MVIIIHQQNLLLQIIPEIFSRFPQKNKHIFQTFKISRSNQIHKILDAFDGQLKKIKKERGVK